MRYQIKVQGNVDPSWSDWFDGMGVSSASNDEGNDETTVTGFVDDQATLRGILNHLWDLNLTLLSVIRIESQG